MEPTKNKWEARVVLNPTVIKEKETEHIFYRAVNKNLISSIGYAKFENNEIQRFFKRIASYLQEQFLSRILYFY